MHLYIKPKPQYNAPPGLDVLNGPELLGKQSKAGACAVGNTYPCIWRCPIDAK